MSLPINLKWAKSNQRSQQDPAPSLAPLPLSHLIFSPPPPPRSAPYRARSWSKNLLKLTAEGRIEARVARDEKTLTSIINKLF